MTRTVFDTAIRSLPRIHQGKVRDIFAVGEDQLLMVASDRVSAFDVVMPNPAPGKGALLTDVALFWFTHFHDVPNHLTDTRLEDVLRDDEELAEARGRSMLVKRLDTLPVEAVVRGYLIGSGWKDYQDSGAVCGITLPTGLRQADKLPEPVFTPATKAAVGDHDENIDFDEMANRIGRERAEDVRRVSIDLYQRRSPDTRFEPVLASRPLPTRHQPTEFRQTIPARLARNARLGQNRPRSDTAPRCHRGHTRRLPRSA